MQLIILHPVSDWGLQIKDWLLAGGPLRGYWYLKCLFVYLVAGYIAVKIIKNRIVAGLVVSAIFIMLPNVNFLRMMIIFFWLGYAYNLMNQYIINRGGYCVLLVATIMTVCYVMGWNKYTYLGANGIADYCKFILMGASAALFWILSFNILFKSASTNKVVCFCAWIGTVSLGIYCIHPLFYEEILWRPIADHYLSGISTSLYLWSLIAIIFCLGIIKLILKSRVLSFLLMGKKL